MANDKVFNTVELYFDHLIDKDEALRRLRYEKPNMQICFPHGTALSYLRFEGSEETVNANPILLQKKYARIVECFSVKAGISLAKALDFFYHSETYPLISQGVIGPALHER